MRASSPLSPSSVDANAHNPHFPLLALNLHQYKSLPLLLPPSHFSHIYSQCHPEFYFTTTMTTVTTAKLRHGIHGACWLQKLNRLPWALHCISAHNEIATWPVGGKLWSTSICDMCIWHGTDADRHFIPQARRVYLCEVRVWSGRCAIIHTAAMMIWSDGTVTEFQIEILRENIFRNMTK